MTRLVLICHAETDATRRAAFALDEGLTPAGLAAARSAGVPMRADVVLRSPARAARESAEAMGLAATVDPALRDLDVGRWAGLAFADLGGAEAAAFLADPACAGHGGESIAALLGRVASWLDALRGERGRILAVTHAAVVRAAVVAALDAPAAAFFRIDAAPLSHVVLGGDGRRWTLRAHALQSTATPVT